ncbi:PilW family protein [Lacisediminimonas profundi]|uniref:PilW family protein n=1 Tax=Lacisediminimonas profundi TaxID=2603856 RepID=UPI0013866296|nr:PilW family protein [Lacisediminimonas profundi]
MRAAGMTLVEMLVCLVLAMLLALAAIGLLMSSRAGFSAQDAGVRLDESGLYALAVIERAVRQAGYENWSAQGAALVDELASSPSIIGLDDALQQDASPALESVSSPGVNGSDVLALRFFGSGDSSGDGDGTMVNCAGAAVPEPARDDLDAGRGWSIFHVARDSSGEPELRCKYRARNGQSWDGEAIVPGVEGMQVLYGIDANGDGLPDRYARADVLYKMDQATAAAANGGASIWKDVVAVRVALLVRGTGFASEAAGDKVLDFFGARYSSLNASVDRGVRFDERALPASQRKRLRRLFSLAIPLKHRAGKKSAAAQPT